MTRRALFAMIGFVPQPPRTKLPITELRPETTWPNDGIAVMVAGRGYRTAALGSGLYLDTSAEWPVLRVSRMAVDSTIMIQQAPLTLNPISGMWELPSQEMGTVIGYFALYRDGIKLTETVEYRRSAPWAIQILDGGSGTLTADYTVLFVKSM